MLIHVGVRVIKTMKKSCHTLCYSLCSLTALLTLSADADNYHDLNKPPHNYNSTKPMDRFTSKVKERLQMGRLNLPRENHLAYLKGLLGELEIPVESQMLVFSATSLQSSIITGYNPRAIYFNDDTYIGYVPGGDIEVLSTDPQLGAIMYIFEPPYGNGNPDPIRATRCMRCHSGAEQGHVPGLSIRSVIPGSNWGSLDAFRVDKTGHDIPVGERLGGWYVTGDKGISHKGNGYSPSSLT